jgi:hypothetical protein
MIAAVLIGLLACANAFHTTHRASCERELKCNGNLMCAYVCKRGTVEVDAWATAAVSYQRQLQKNDKLVYFELPSTHNSAMTEADGYGIEKYFISALYDGKNEDTGDDVGEGVCQYLSLTDQLRIGIRHLEIDLWWGPVEKDVVVCHSPIPLFPFENVSRAAEAKNISLEWQPSKMSCIGQKRQFTEVLKEVNDWMTLPENSQELVFLYFDTKFYLSPDQITQANNEIKAVYGDMLWTAASGSPLKYTPSELLGMGKRLFIENAKECWSKPASGEQVVFYPTLWTHQFSAGELLEFPDCSVEGDTNWYGSQWVRALDGSFIEAATRCGVQVVSADYINPDDMKLYVWSWDQQEPRVKDGCVAMLPNGRWATLDCNEQHYTACVKSESVTNGDNKEWFVDLNIKSSYGKGNCAAGYEFGAPHNGYTNNRLLLAGVGQTVWLNAPNPLSTKK